MLTGCSISCEMGRMSKSLIPDYPSLLTRCRNLVQGSGKEAKASLLAYYWSLGSEVGRAIGRHAVKYGSATVGKLAKDLDLSKTDIYNSIKFARKFSSDEISPRLTWSHYRIILTLEKDAAHQLALRALRENLSVSKLRELAGHKRAKRNQVKSSVVCGLKIIDFAEKAEKIFSEKLSIASDLKEIEREDAEKVIKQLVFVEKIIDEIKAEIVKVHDIR